MYTPPETVLRGYSFEKIRNLGMPHMGSHYTGPRVDQFKRDEDAVCVICGKKAHSTHHVVPRGFCHSWNLYTPRGITLLRSPLISLCGSGTTGCHGKFEHNILVAKWVFDDDEFARMFYEGELLDEFLTNDPMMFDYGQWYFVNTRTGEIVKRRLSSW